MKTLFVSILNMNFTASMIILIVLCVRLMLNRCPKIFSYALWSVVLFRLLCPVSLSSGISLLEIVNPPVATVRDSVSMISYVPLDDPLPESFNENLVFSEPGNTPVHVSDSASESTPDILQISTCIWILGITAMLLHSLFSYVKHRQMLSESIPITDQIFEGDQLPTAFVLGIFRPRIYLPSFLSESERPYIIAHEQYHIRRKDHIWKILGYIALCIHWFNPLVWLSFILAAKDMEMSCDEAVIKNMGSTIRADYATSLVNLACNHWRIAGTPLSFGEGNTQQRVLHLATLKRPTAYMIAFAAILSCTVILVSALNPEMITVPTVKNDYSMTVYDEVNPREGTLIIRKSPDDTAHVTTTSEYWIEIERNKCWKNLPELTNGQESASEILEVTDLPRWEVLNWEQRYGPLPAGKYRIGKKFSIDGTPAVMYAEFRIYAAEIPGTKEQLAVDRCYTALDCLNETEQLHYTIFSSVGDVREVYRNGDNFYQLWTYPDDYPGEKNRGRIEGIITFNGTSYKLAHKNPKDQTSVPIAWEIQETPVGIFLETQFFRNTRDHIYFPEGSSEISEKKVSFLTDYSGAPNYRYCRVTYNFDGEDQISALTWDSTNWYHDGGIMTITFHNTSAEKIDTAIKQALTKYPIFTESTKE